MTTHRTLVWAAAATFAAGALTLLRRKKPPLTALNGTIDVSVNGKGEMETHYFPA